MAKLGLVQGVLAEIRARRVGLSTMPAPTLKGAKGDAPAVKGGSRSAAVKKAWMSRRRG